MNLKTVTWALALSAALLYLLCIAYGLANPLGGHMREFLTIALSGFEWLTPKGFAIGLVKSFLYGALFGLVFVPTYNTLQRRFGSRKPDDHCDRRSARVAHFFVDTIMATRDAARTGYEPGQAMFESRH